MVIETLANPYLEGNYAPVREETEAENLRIIGELPKAMDGMYVRTGPNPQFDPKGQYHWFDGDGMLHGVRVKDGKASYRNRYVVSKGYLEEKAAGTAIFYGLMEMEKNFAQGRGYKNQGNTALVWHDGQLLTLMEGAEPHAVGLPGLTTLGTYDFCGKLISSFTAHPKVDERTGEMMFFGYNPMSAPYVQYSLVSKEGELQFTRPIEIPRGIMMHDFAITEHYTIFMDQPLTFSIERARKGEPVLAFERDLPARYGIMPRYGTNDDIKWFEMPAHYVFHTSNAYEDGDDVVLHACRLESTNVLQPAELPKSRDGDVAGGDPDPMAVMHRWRFNMKTGTFKEEQVDDIPTDFPRVDDRLVGYGYRYSYNARFRKVPAGMPPSFEGINKYDLKTGRVEVHLHGKERFGGEPVFVPNPKGKDEDDGWLVTFVYDEVEGTSEMVVVDAKDVASKPLARVMIPTRVPYGFHGAWIADDRIENQRQHRMAWTPAEGV
jgi:carotenoid cleavage dioxygenase-like enzyme